MGVLALCLVCIVLSVNALTKKSENVTSNILDIACKQLALSRCPAYRNWTHRCLREKKRKGSVGRSGRFRVTTHTHGETWDEALRVCKSKGGTLAMPKTPEKQKVLKRKAWFFYGAYWIGLNDFEGNNHYRWLDGEPLTYRLWREGEPNNVYERCVLYVASLQPSEEGWIDVSCDRRQPFLCEN